MSIKHSHKVHRYANINGTWTCTIRGCRHFLPGNVPRGPLGRESVCNACGDDFIMDNVSLTQKNPICQTCDCENPIRLLGGADIEFDTHTPPVEIKTN